MPYDHNARKVPLTVTVNADLLREARDLDLDLDAEVEAALSARTERQRRLRERETALRPALEAMNEFRARHGSLADDFPPE